MNNSRMCCFFTPKMYSYEISFLGCLDFFYLIGVSQSQTRKKTIKKKIHFIMASKSNAFCSWNLQNIKFAEKYFELQTPITSCRFLF